MANNIRIEMYDKFCPAKDCIHNNDTIFKFHTCKNSMSQLTYDKCGMFVCDKYEPVVGG